MSIASVEISIFTGQFTLIVTIAIDTTTTRWFNPEDDILRYVFLHSVAPAGLAGIFVTLQAYVFPFSMMVVK